MAEISINQEAENEEKKSGSNLYERVIALGKSVRDKATNLVRDVVSGDPMDKRVQDAKEQHRNKIDNLPRR